MNDLVVITGTSSGIGTAIAKKFLYEEYNVIGIDIKEEPKGQIWEYFKTLGKYHHYIADITKPETLPDIEDVSILINNAGVQNSEDDIEVNLKGTINVTKKYGLSTTSIKSILMIASTSAHNGCEFPEYAASKGGLLSYTKNVAKQIAPLGATCNSISPGGVLTSINDVVMKDIDLWEQVMNDTPLKRWATADEIAEWVFFLTVTNKFMTGQDVIVDGGESINQTFYWK